MEQLELDLGLDESADEKECPHCGSRHVGEQKDLFGGWEKICLSCWERI